jgi:hypothetical protein
LKTGQFSTILPCVYVEKPVEIFEKELSFKHLKGVENPLFHLWTV